VLSYCPVPNAAKKMEDVIHNNASNASVYAGQYPKNGVTVAEICGLDGK